MHSTPLDALLGGLLQSTVCCSVCGRSSHSFEYFLDLSLPLPRRPATLTLEVLSAPLSPTGRCTVPRRQEECPCQLHLCSTAARVYCGRIAWLRSWRWSTCRPRRATTVHTASSARPSPSSCSWQSCHQCSSSTSSAFQQPLALCPRPVYFQRQASVGMQANSAKCSQLSKSLRAWLLQSLSIK